LKFLHISPASLEIGRQWVVEAHRAGPLTLAAVRLPGAEALSGEISESVILSDPKASVTADLSRMPVILSEAKDPRLSSVILSEAKDPRLSSVILSEAKDPLISTLKHIEAKYTR